jgi:non-specific protein-tyrosine kinase
MKPFLQLLKRQEIRTNPDSLKITSDISGIWNAPSYDTSQHFKLNLQLLEKNRCLCIYPDTEVTKYYTQLRTQITQRLKLMGWNTVMITSAGDNTGKTLTSINLALTFAKTCDDTVLLVDGDLKNQTIHKYMGLPGKKGLTDVILNTAPIRDVMVWPGIDKLTIISGGQSVNSGSEILGSPQMAAIACEMKQRYSDRYVFFDLPSSLQSSDAFTFAPLVDCILIVIEEGKTTNSEVVSMIEKLPKEKILGYVFNKKTNI